MGYFEKTLDPLKFVRVHRSYIINVEHITRIDTEDKDNHIAVLRSGKRIPVSRSGYPRLKQVLQL